MMKRNFRIICGFMAAALLAGSIPAAAQTTGEEETAAAEETAEPVESVEENLPWWKEAVFLEIYPKSFKDSNGDGYGDLQGIIEELDYLESLGIGAIWLTPIYQSPKLDGGYDISDYCSIDPLYGTMEDMDELLAKAGEKNIKIIMDLVFNHTSNQHEWFLESSSSRDNEKADWYIWRDPAPDGSAPTNWRSIFGISAWTWCEARGQYYLHTFLSEQPDLNWENPQVRQALYDAANFWAEKGVGGFRVDAITYIKKPEVFESGEPDDSDGLYSVHTATANTPGILDFLHEMKENVFEKNNVFSVGEANGVPKEELTEWVGSEGVFDMIFEFGHVNVQYKGTETWYQASNDWPLSSLKRALTGSQEATAEDGWCPVFFENHDQTRSVNHFMPRCEDKKAAAKALAVIMTTLRGTPFLYQGQELGLANTAFSSIDDYDDANARGQYVLALKADYTEEEALAVVQAWSRDNARTPMQFDDSEQAGFTTGTPWLPVHEDYALQNVAAEDADEDSVLNWYRRLIGLRENSNVLLHGDYRELMADSEEVYAYERSCGEEKAVILVNFSENEVSYDEELTAGAALLSSIDDAPAAGILRPYEAVIALFE